MRICNKRSKVSIRAALILASLALAISSLPIKGAFAEEYSAIRITDSVVNVRFGPGMEQPRMGTANYGDVYELINAATENNFYNILFKGASAFVSCELAELTNAKPNEGARTGKVARLRSIQSSYSESVRSQPNSSSSVIGSIRKGEELPLLDTKSSNGYFKVSCNGRTGYVRTTYVDIIGWLPQQPVYSEFESYIRVKPKTQSIYSWSGGASVGTVYRGDILPLLGATEDGYCEVWYDGSSAYLPKSAVESAKPEPIVSTAVSWYAIVSIAKQTVTVYHNGELVRFMSCSTGASSTPTPTGTYKVPYKKEYFLSHSLTCFDAVKIVDNSGIYFHRIPRNDNGTYSGFIEALGSRASAGCVRLPEVHSRWMYANFPSGATVKIK